MTAIPPGFLAAILENPRDDTPRLILADWLEENGEPERAELIRVQCELWPLLPSLQALSVGDKTAEVPGMRALRLTTRERELLLANQRTWFPLLAELVRPGTLISDYICWTRGFVSETVCDAHNWLTHCQAVLAQQPIETVQMRDLTLSVWADGQWHCRLNASVDGPGTTRGWFGEGSWPSRPAMIWNHPNWLTCLVEELKPLHNETLERQRRLFWENNERQPAQAGWDEWRQAVIRGRI